MPGQPSEQELCQAVLDFVAEGAYPDSEQIVSAEFPLSALAKELELLALTRDQVEVEISLLSRENEFDADGWISQAKQLHADLERSRLTAREIVAEHEKTRPLKLKVEDAAAKVELIEKEIMFNEAVTDTLEEVQRLCQQLEAGRALHKKGQVMDAIDTLEAIEHTLSRDTGFANTNVMSILQESVAGLRQEIVDLLRTRWDEHLNFYPKQGKLVVSGNDGDMLEESISALARLNVLVPANDKFQKALFLTIIDPILLPNKDGFGYGITVGESSIFIDSEPSATSVSDLLDRISSVLGFLHQHLPPSILDPLSGSFIPKLCSKIISCWLSSSIPTELGGLGEFETNLNHIREFAKTIEGYGWHGQEELISWVNQAPRLWLTRRRVDSLDQVRKVIAASQGTTRRVERVEKKQISEADEILQQQPTSDDWDASWDDNTEEQQSGHKDEEEEEDVSAWGLDDDDNDTIDQAVATPDTTSTPEDDDAGDAWGWGEDDEEEQGPGNSSQTKGSTVTKSVNGNDTSSHPGTREVTLTEKYTITDIPDSVIQIIQQQILDSEAISQPSHAHTLVSSSGAGLLAIPTLIIAMFKAIAPSFYDLKLNAGRMYLYNDSLYLADRVREIADYHQLTRLHTDIEALDKFGKFAYSREMQTQRTIVTDLLDGAQGFSECSEQPFLGECENAVRATVDRIRKVCEEWKHILSHSALLQSIGSLVSTVINKVIIDIEDLGDISESQSQKLVSFCNQLSKLEELFVPDTASSAEPVPMTAVYVRSWLKFQYLINILESSLADIKFLWQEGELSLEFSADEVVDLIEALFAESDYRRRAIADIRRVSRG